MTHEMIKRVAKAIWDDACPGMHPTMDDIKHYSSMAIAAINAMRSLYQNLPGPVGNQEDHLKLNAAIDQVLK